MNKRMRELLNKIETKRVEAQGFVESAKAQEAMNAIAEIKDLESLFMSEQKLYEMSKSNVPDEPKSGTPKIDGFSVMAKLLRKGTLTDVESALITGSGAESGENYLIPEDVDVTIRELRKTYVSAKDLLTVIPTMSLTGSFVFESGAPSGLESFDDGSDIPMEDNPTFFQKDWKVRLMGKLIPISNILRGAERAGLTAYINRWFVRNSIISENESVFSALKNGKTVKELKGLQALKSSMNVDLDPSCLIDGVIVTNQTGFDEMDKETDAVGRPMLARDISRPAGKRFNGLPIFVFPNTTLPNENDAAPIFYGSLKAGAYFIDFMSLQFAVSEHVFFKRNQTALRVIQGFATMQADKDAYMYGAYVAADPVVVHTKGIAEPAETS